MTKGRPWFTFHRLVAFFFLAALAFAQPCLGVSIGFESTGTLANARYGHTATLLPNGKVLVVGGFVAGQRVASAELYDPASGTWTATGNLRTPRNSHTATLLPNGKVLVVGGGRSQLEIGLVIPPELYDPSSGTWTTIGTFDPGSGHTATLLPSGKVLVVGGYTNGLGYGCGYSGGLGANLYNPASETWTPTGVPSSGRSSHSATLLPDGKVLVAGGAIYTTSCSHSILSTAELYDPATGIWTATGSLASARSSHKALLLPTGQVLVAGGAYTPPGYSPGTGLASAELYNPESGTWTSTGSLATARVSHTMTLLPNGNVLVAGGASSSAAESIRASAELYHPATGTWIATGSLRTLRSGHTATLLPNGEVLVAGVILEPALSRARKVYTASRFRRCSIFPHGCGFRPATTP